MGISSRKNAPVRAGGMACLILLTACGMAGAQVNRSLRIFYAGRPGSDRERDFVKFLREHFDSIQTGNLQTFKEADTQGFDVTLLDWDTNEFKGPRPTVSEDFSRPIMTLGVPGALICSQWRLKTGYL